MPANKATPPNSIRKWTSWKLDLQEAAISDPRLKIGQLRMLLYVLHKARMGKGEAVLPDEDIMEDVPGFKEQSSVYRVRKHIAEIGYWDYQSGSGTRATVYTLSDAPVANVLAKVKRDQMRRRDERSQKRTARKSGKETLQSQHKAKRKKPGEKAFEGLQTAIQLSVTDAGITPSLSPSLMALRQQDVTQKASALPLRCTDCGEPAVIRDQRGGTLYCQECADDNFLFEPESIQVIELPAPLDVDDSDDIPGPPISYAKASRGS